MPDYALRASFVLDPSGLLGYLDGPAAAMLGLAPEECLGRPLDAFLAPEDRGRVKDLLVPESAGRAPVTLRLARAGGETLSVEIASAPVRDAAGEAIAYVLSATDPEAERLREGRLIQMDKLAGLGELLAGISHELSNRLSPVVGYSELLLQGETDAKRREWISVLHRSAEGADRIVRSLLGLARPESGQGQFVDVNTVVSDLLDVLRFKARRRPIELRAALAPGLPGTVVDRFRLEQVLINLVNNAMQALGEAAGSIEISTEALAEDRIAIHVFDTGPGIAPEHQGRVFDRFFTTKAPGEGTGLGLALCRGFVEQQGGALTFESRPGRTVFTIALPVVDRRKTERRLLAPERADPELRGATAVLLQKDATSAAVIRELLESQRVGVIVAEGVADFFDALELPGKVQAVLVDPEGWESPLGEILDGLRDRRPELADRVVLLLGDRTRAEGETTRGVAAATLTKPYTLRNLLGALRHLVHGAGEGRGR